jgi:L-amino acid N-acyltransferase YncA
MLEITEIRKENSDQIRFVFEIIDNDLSDYKFDQYILYPKKNKDFWISYLKSRIEAFLQSDENSIQFFNFGNSFCLLGLRFSEWDKNHFEIEMANIFIFYTSGNINRLQSETAISMVIEQLRTKKTQFISVRINGDNLNIIHTLEGYSFKYFENIIWPVKIIDNQQIQLQENVRLLRENELDKVMNIAKTYQYQRGHYHCDSNFNAERVNSLYAKWVKSAWENGENILVVEHKGKVAGYFISAIDEKLSDHFGYRYGRMKSLALDGQLRGFGLGKKLFEGTCILLRNQGAEVIDSGYSTKNHTSAKLHTQNGFYSVYEEVTMHLWLN